MEQLRKSIEQLNKLHKSVTKLKQAYPAIRTPYSMNHGSILNAYREGDISFDVALKELGEVTRLISESTKRASRIKLKRTGQAPIELLAVEKAGAYFEHERRKFKATIYQSDESKRFVLYIEYASEWPSEFESAAASVHGNLEAVSNYLEAYNPMQLIRGFPDDPKYAKRQAALEWRITVEWGKLVSNILEAAGYAEELK